MRYKVTARRDIHILANVPNDPTGEGKVRYPAETMTWVSLVAGRPHDGLGKIVGIDPRCVRETNTVTEGHFTFVPIKCTEADYCKVHFGLFQIEQSSMPD
jgi:hypothetical protein